MLHFGAGLSKARGIAKTNMNKIQEYIPGLLFISTIQGFYLIILY